jgi:hypothetical protein
MDNQKPGFKTKFERVQDSVEILKKLKGLGFNEVDSGYLGTKKALDAWIADGEAREEQIPFYRAGRVAHMSLPSKAGRKPAYVLKATEELKEEISRKEREERRKN